MWHGKSAISKGTGYSHGRTVRRGGQDSSIRNSNKTEASLGAINILGFLLVLGMFLMLIGVI
jgi:hypothetical protein